MTDIAALDTETGRVYYPENNTLASAPTEAWAAIGPKLVGAVTACERLELDKQHEQKRYAYASAGSYYRAGRKALSLVGLFVLSEMLEYEVLPCPYSEKMQRYAGTFEFFLVDSETGMRLVSRLTEIVDDASSDRGLAKLRTYAMKSYLGELLLMSESASDIEQDSHQQKQQQRQHRRAREAQDRQPPPPTKEESEVGEATAYEQHKERFKETLAATGPLEWNRTIMRLTEFDDVPRRFHEPLLQQVIHPAEAFYAETWPKLAEMTDELMQASQESKKQLGAVTATWRAYIDELRNTAWSMHFQKVLASTLENIERAKRNAEEAAKA